MNCGYVSHGMLDDIIILTLSANKILMILGDPVVLQSKCFNEVA